MIPICARCGRATEGRDVCDRCTADLTENDAVTKAEGELDDPRPTSRAATRSFAAATGLLPLLFLLRVILDPNPTVSRPEFWIVVLNWAGLAAAIAIFGFATRGYVQTRHGAMHGFAKTGLAAVIAFLFALLTFVELTN
jgi:hypothetical protein